MTPTLRRAGLLAFALVAVAVIAWNLIPSPGSVAQPSGPELGYGLPPPAQPPVPSAPPPVAATTIETRDYAIALGELQGLPPDAAPGTRLELWVTWDRPVTDAPKLQRVLAEAALVRVVPSVTPDGPAAAVIRVPTERMPKLLYADGYGLLSAAVLP